MRFTDQPGYVATVLNGARASRPAAPFPAAPLPTTGADVPVSSVVTAMCAVLGAVALALAALYWRRLPLLKHGNLPGARSIVLVERTQSGVVNDYVTWLVAGVACLGGVLALVVR